MVFAPPGETLDLSSVELAYTPSMGPSQSWTQVAGSSECTAGAFYLQGTTAVICPATCTLVESDPSAQLTVSAGCV